MAPVRTALAEQHTVSDAVRTEATKVVTTAHDRRITLVTMHLEDGSTIELPEQLSTFLAHLVQGAAKGATIFTATLPEELTTTVAADQLGVSRPTLMKMIEAGELPATKVKSHTRLRRDDVLELRRAREARRKLATIELLEAGETFD